MVMRMLEAGGVFLLVDDHRPADDSNPRGYFEYAPVKRLKDDASWLPLARGRAVKVVSYLLPFLPSGEAYRVLFLSRPLAEVAASQAKMMRKPADVSGDVMHGLMARQDAHARAWLAHMGAPVLDLAFAEIHAAPEAAARRIAAFLGREMDKAAMAYAVDAALYRNRLLK